MRVTDKEALAALWRSGHDSDAAASAGLSADGLSAAPYGPRLLERLGVAGDEQTFRENYQRFEQQTAEARTGMRDLGRAFFDTFLER